MVVGADVTHPQKGSGCPSMAAVVATSDESSNQYLGSGRLQKGKDEVSACKSHNTPVLTTISTFMTSEE